MPVIRPSSSLPAAAVAALLLAACAGGGASTSGDGRNPQQVRRPTSSDDPLSAVDIPEPAGADERMRIGEDATRDLDAFLAGERTVMGEQTTVIMSRTPFLAMSAFSVNHDHVQRTERRDADGALVITLTNRDGVKTRLDWLPRVEVGGLLFVGVDRLELRYAMHTDVDHPIALRAVAEGKAAYRDAREGDWQRGGRVLLEAQVDGSGDTARFSERTRIDP